ncbi:MAG TPA: four helix bundle protein [Terriglobales bacterium]|nr:four helix bundle protein [Terriglobales bacterium]
MTPDELKQRTRRFAVGIIRLCRSIPRTYEARVIGRQLIRSGSSVGANYNSACRARSRPEFLSKLNIVLEEADETLYWLDLLIDSDLIPSTKVEPLRKEANELVSIFVASLRTAKGVAQSEI